MQIAAEQTREHGVPLRAAAATAVTSRREPSVPRAVLVQCHVRDRRQLRRLVNAAARVAWLAWHAAVAVARVCSLTIAAPGAIGMVLADSASVVADQARDGF